MRPLTAATCITLAAAILCLPLAAHAGTTGKITGKVTSGGLPLPGANIIIGLLATGTTADAEGDYVIVNLPPGTYTVTASMIGYETVSVKDALVVVDQTRVVDFSLQETAFQLGEVMIVAERPLVDPARPRIEVRNAGSPPRCGQR